MTRTHVLLGGVGLLSLSACLDYDPDGYWDYLERTLPQITDWTAWDTDPNTLYACDNARKATMTWMINAWDIDGNRADCAVWGHDPSVFDGCSCQNWN